MKTKSCPKCGIVKPLLPAFYYPNRGRHSGFQTYCKACTVLDHHSDRYKRQQKAYRQTEKGRLENRARSLAYSISPKGRTQRCLRLHGLTPAEEQTALSKQRGLCAICRQPLVLYSKPQTGQELAHLDHNHKHCPANKSCKTCFRGFLCGRCNRMLGLAKDNPLTLRRAAEYLEAK